MNQIGNFITKGKNVAKESMEQVNKAIKNLTNEISKIDKEMKVLQNLSATNNLKAHELNSAYYNEYLPIKANLRNCRLKLKRLAKKTVNMSKKIKGYYDKTNIEESHWSFK